VGWRVKVSPALFQILCRCIVSNASNVECCFWKPFLLFRRGRRFVSRYRRFLPVAISVISLAAPAFAEDHFCANQQSDEHHKHKGKHVEHKHAPEVKQSIVVNAKAANVWEAIQQNRKTDDHRKLLSYDGTAATLHETFAALPIVGEASCDYVERESQPLERIDYTMVKSDRFHVFEGTWRLTPGKTANQTVVELSNTIDPGIRVPFWQDITKMAANRMVKRRLDAISAYAEQLERGDKTVIR